MLTEQTIEKLYAMKLNGMADGFKEQLQQPDINELAFEDRFALVVDRQWTWMEDRRMTRLLSNAKLKINGCIEDIDYRTPRGIDKSVILRLADCEWIRNAQNLILTGPTGVGKPIWPARWQTKLAAWATRHSTSASRNCSKNSLLLEAMDHIPRS
jgi:DNA replication protein DnaC